MAQISLPRWNELERIAAQDPAIRFPVIVTLKEGASPESLENSGLQVEHRSFNIVSGTASLAVLKELSAMNEVELVEEDGEVRAIHGSRF
jgi:hypothetical protein